MHSLASPLTAAAIAQRVLALLVMAFVLFGGVSPSAYATPGDKLRCGSAALAAQTCAQQRERSQDKAPRHVLDVQSGEPDVPSVRLPQRWLSADTFDRGRTPAAWLASPAHHPPKIILFCTLLI